MALSDKNIIITPNIGSASDPKIQFSGADASTGAQTITLNVYPTSGGMLSFEGSSGQLFSIANSLTGTIYSVTDISGVPSIEVLDSGLVKLAQYNGNVSIGTGSSSSFKLNVYGPDYYQLRLSAPNNPLLKFSGSYNSGNGAEIWQNGSGTLLFNVNGNQTAASMFAGPYTEIYGSTRSPIFYDYNDTGYYLDPNSVSVVNDLRISSGNIQLVQNNPAQNLKFRALAGSVDAGISFYDANNRWIMQLYAAYGSSSEYGFLNGNWGSWDLRKIANGNLYMNNNNNYYLNAPSDNYMYRVYAAADTRSPIFYDLDDTGYYANPAGTSYLYAGQIYGQWQFIANRNTSSDSPPLQAFSNNGSGAIMAFHRSGQYAVNFGLDSDNVMRIGGWSASANRWQLDMSGNQWVAGSLRAPIFYDSDATDYYVDPGSTGTSINAAGSIRGVYYVASNYASTGYTQYKGYDNNNHFIVIRGAVSGNTSALTLTGGHQTTFVEYAEANDGTGWFFKTAATGNYDIVSRITRSYSSFESSVRSPIFYDSDDTGYYIDAQSTAAAALRMRGGALFGPNPTWSAYLYVGGNGDYDSAQAQIFTTNGNLHLEPGSGHAIYLDNYRGGWFRANGWYDTNDTSYYVDPNSYSYVNALRAGSYLASSGNIYTDANYGYGLVGVYTSTRYQGVFAMSDSYKLALDGTTTGNLYGIAWSHPNAGGVASNLNTHGALIMENGSFLAALSGSIRCRDDMRAPLYYDSNDTGYYCDPASTNRLNFVNSNNHYIQPGYMLYSDHGSWAGEANKIQWHSSHLYLQNAGGGYLLILRRGDGGERFYCDYNGNVTASGNITAYSDASLKTNVETIQSPIQLVKRLRGVTFDWIESGEHSYGLIAQEVEQVIPELVMENENGTADGDESVRIKSVDYSKLVSVLIEAVKEQQSEIDELKSLVKQLLAK